MSGQAPEDHEPGSSAGERCLVTGATGFIGGHIARRLAREGYSVRCLVRATSDTSCLDGLRVETTIGDLASADSLTRLAGDCRFVVHCGAVVSDWAPIEEIRRVNIDGTRNLLEASVRASVERFIHLSTTDVYGYPGTPGVAEHYEARGFSNWYSETKRAAEDEVQRIERAHELETVILRPATVYGPRSDAVVAEMARAICANQMLLIDGGRAIAGLIYVENVVDAVLLALRSPAASGEAFNLTDGLDITWRRFLEDLADGLGCRRPRWSVPYGVAHGVAFLLEHGYRLLHRAAGVRTRALLSRQAVHVLARNQDFSNRKAREALGWDPRVSYEAGLAATLAWLRESGLGH